MTTALVCGGRDLDWIYDDALRALDEAWRVHCQFDNLVTGDAAGADEIARSWAKSRKMPCRVFYADWERYGKGAGHIRNQEMLDKGCPDIVFAFPGGPGTADMMSRTVRAKIKLVRLTP